MAVETRKERIDIRVTKMDKDLIEKAAASSHLSLSSYVISVVLKQARLDIIENETIKLNEEESIRFMQIMNNPPEPNEKLKDLLNGIDFNKGL